MCSLRQIFHLVGLRSLYAAWFFSSNCMIYSSQKRRIKKSIGFGTAGWEGKCARSVTQVALFILRKPALRANDLPHYRLVPVCSNLLTTVQSIYHLPSLGITAQWYGLIAQQYAKTYPFHPTQSALSSRPLSAWGRLESGWRTAGLKHTLTSQYCLKGEDTGITEQYTGTPSFAGLWLGQLKYYTAFVSYWIHLWYWAPE